jgi:hypothetical protein
VRYCSVTLWNSAHVVLGRDNHAAAVRLLRWANALRCKRLKGASWRLQQTGDAEQVAKLIEQAAGMG